MLLICYWLSVHSRDAVLEIVQLLFSMNNEDNLMQL